MDDPPSGGTPPRALTNRLRLRLRRGLLLFAAAAALGAVLALALLTRGDAGDGDARRGGEGSQPTPGDELVVGDVAPLGEGAVGRVNSVRPGVRLAPELPRPEAGTTLVRLDVELCAGAAALFVDSAFWLGVGDDDRVYSAHMGVRDLVTLTLAPGTCQRGTVDLAVAEGVDLAAVLLMDESHTTVARWSVQGRPGQPEPLSAAVDPDLAVVGSPAGLTAGGSVTLHGFTRGADATSVRLDVEVCAGGQELPTGPRSWFVQLDDHRLVASQPGDSTMPSVELAPGACQRGTVGFVTGGTVGAVIYAHGGALQEARWRVDD